MAAQEELPEAMEQPHADQVPLTRRDVERSAQQDLPAVLRLIDLGNVAVSAKTMQATAERYEQVPAQSASLTVYPDLRLQVEGEPLTADETLLLETYAQPEAAGAWRLDRDRTLEALETGGRIDELREFLTARDDQPLPETVEGFLDATARRAQALVPQGPALLVECADAALAELLATQEPTDKLCRRTGERGIVIRAEVEDKFRKAIRQLGYGMPRA